MSSRLWIVGLRDCLGQRRLGRQGQDKTRQGKTRQDKAVRDMVFFGAGLAFEALIMRRYLQTACPAGPSQPTDRSASCLFLAGFFRLVSSHLVLVLVLVRRRGSLIISRSARKGLPSHGPRTKFPFPPVLQQYTVLRRLRSAARVHVHLSSEDPWACIIIIINYCLRAPCPREGKSVHGKLIPTVRSTTNRRRSASHMELTTALGV
ncbi:hypothetical protein BC826DRAFT_47667 [Russula brevipes]|nr:hypothetical protein BC826DRAFT_47667 [Russula brevipes]